MRECFKCGFKDLPIWRHKRFRLYTCYCRLDELEMYDAELAKLVAEKHDLKIGGYIYHLTKSQYVDRIHELDSLDGTSWREPDQEKHKCRFLVPGQQLLQEKTRKNECPCSLRI